MSSTKSGQKRLTVDLTLEDAPNDPDQDEKGKGQKEEPPKRVPRKRAKRLLPREQYEQFLRLTYDSLETKEKEAYHSMSVTAWIKKLPASAIPLIYMCHPSTGYYLFQTKRGYRLSEKARALERVAEYLESREKIRETFQTLFPLFIQQQIQHATDQLWSAHENTARLLSSVVNYQIPFQLTSLHPGTRHYHFEKVIQELQLLVPQGVEVFQVIFRQFKQWFTERPFGTLSLHFVVKFQKWISFAPKKRMQFRITGVRAHHTFHAETGSVWFPFPLGVECHVHYKNDRSHMIDFETDTPAVGNYHNYHSLSLFSEIQQYCLFLLGDETVDRTPWEWLLLFLDVDIPDKVEYHPDVCLESRYFFTHQFFDENVLNIIREYTITSY
jgi:hypothetical protein